MIALWPDSIHDCLLLSLWIAHGPRSTFTPGTLGFQKHLDPVVHACPEPHANQHLEGGGRNLIFLAGVIGVDLRSFGKWTTLVSNVIIFFNQTMHLFFTQQKNIFKKKEVRKMWTNKINKIRYALVLLCYFNIIKITFNGLNTDVYFSFFLAIIKIKFNSVSKK